MTQFDVIADYADICGEGPLWDKSGNALYWTDLSRKRFYRYLASERRAEIVSERLQVSGFRFNQPGGFVVTNISGIWLWDGVSDPKLLASEADGHRCLMNDCVADPQGRLYSGSYYKNPETKKFERAGCLFRVDNDGSVHVVDDGFILSNGLGFSPDQRTLYYTDSADRRIYAYDWRDSDGALSNRRILVQVPIEEGIPDGLSVDAEGFIWSAQWFGGCVMRYDPDGNVERRLETPALQTSAVAFGGPDLTDMYISSAGVSDSEYLAPPGYNPASGYVGGPVYHCNLGIQGQEEDYRARIAVKAA